ncbi:eight-cysteine-cluster domain-containing protein [Thermococcus sp. GR7]|uniref:CGP-CTERM-anchored Cys-rich protein n=1 Tax=unclassified Thermococcus TaxID=2627626 RepID=UPI0014300FCE|nr:MULTISPECIES: CGP-CTERM-anchored Cys-rich protein [unclassified Thermococcus]NJE46174.1 eight-cysteine-cluster domain-containing protein [Thermococcus sp. GR7]NJE78190.1 eight-cysteine-cluster domain-containing protein [Thermococcus sp. GR4]NJF23969.1 eight-cysteine-cluster domain-containing protein [Thermococcus sp. GR5]
MKRVMVLIVFLMFALTPLAEACMSPTDVYAVEVVLNKPGITYKPYPAFNALHNAIVENDTFIFRSHYDKRLVVVLWNASDGPHLRIEIPAEWKETGLTKTAFNASLLITTDALEKLKADGWKTRDNLTFTRDNVTITLTPVAGEECTSDGDCTTGGCSGEVCAPREEATRIVTPCVYREWYTCLGLTSCGCVNGICTWKPNDAFESCLREHGIDPEKVIRAGLVRVEVEAYNMEPGEVEAAVKDFLSAFGVDCNPALTFVEPMSGRLVPVVDSSEVNFSEAVKVELEWLRDVGVLQISDEDIEAIAKVAGPGKAGPNSHIGWYETKDGTYAWIPYEESLNPMLVRCTTDEVPTYNLPNGTAYVGPTVTQSPSTDATTSTESSPNGGICGPALVVGLSLFALLRRR